MKGSWIKCSERMPPVDKDVLTKFDSGENIRILHYSKKTKLWFTPDRETYVYNPPNQWFDENIDPRLTNWLKK